MFFTDPKIRAPLNRTTVSSFTLSPQGQASYIVFLPVRPGPSPANSEAPGRPSAPGFGSVGL